MALGKKIKPDALARHYRQIAQSETMIRDGGEVPRMCTLIESKDGIMVSATNLVDHDGCGESKGTTDVGSSE